MSDLEKQADPEVDSQDSPGVNEEQAPTAELPAAKSDAYLQGMAAVDLLRADGALDPSPLQTVLRLSAAECFEIQISRCEDARSAKFESDGRLVPETLVLDHLGLKAARQGAQMLQVMERTQRQNDTPPKG